MTREIAIKTAAKWWTDKLRQRAPHDNGANDPSNRFAMILADMLATPMSEDQLNKFQQELEKEINASMRNRPGIVLGCDYDPCCTLADAAHRAGINTANFPYKTAMDIRTDRHGNYIVSVSDGYAQPYVDLKPCK